MIHLYGNTYMSEGHLTLGAYLLGNEALLIDSGCDRNYLLNEIKDLELIDIKYIFNTHAHVDHCGGNHYLQHERRSTILAPRIEADFIEYPHLKDIYLYGFTSKNLLIRKSKYAEPSIVYKKITIDEGKDGIPYQLMKILFREYETYFSFLRLKGHSPNMMGIITPDNIAFLGDALLDKSTLAHNQLMYIYNLGDHLYTLYMLEKLEAKAYVISHGGCYNEIQMLITANREHLLNTLEQIHSATKDRGSMTLDQLHGQLFTSLGLNENQITQALNRSTIRAHLYYLQEQGRITSFAEDGVEYIQAL
ncbi:MBL fold metallo-hydrolase [Clostridia bacterium]|nr:MBL fold metallo-hydrolase [Clostridia bacterium]